MHPRARSPGSTRGRTWPLLPAAALLSAACAGPTASGPGRLDARVPEIIRAARDAGKVELRLAVDGTVGKIELYHGDASRVPEAVRTLAAQKMPGAKVKAYELELDGGQVVHEVELTGPDGSQCEISATEAGVLRYIECDLKPDALPETVRAAALARFPGAELLEAERKTSPDGESFKVELKAAGRKHVVGFTTDGKLLADMLVVEAEIEVPAP